jgi:hypothetical protein
LLIHLHMMVTTISEASEIDSSKILVVGSDLLWFILSEIFVF